MKLLYQKEKYKKFNLRRALRANKKLQKRKKNKNIFHKTEGVNTKHEKITFPKEVFLESEDEKIFRYINDTEKLKQPIFDFSYIKNIDVGSALYIKAYIDYLKSNGKKVTIKCSPKNQKMRQILQHIKIFDYELKITHKDIACWVIKTWNTDTQVNYGKVMMEEVLPAVLTNKFPSEEFTHIAGNLNELLANCSEHAYTKKDTFKNYYLIAGEYTTEFQASNTFSFCILDSGQGFKNSIKNKTKWEKFWQIISKEKEVDSKLLQATVEGKFNANKHQNTGRGAGLPEVVKSVKIIKGDLYLYSDKGCFSITDGAKEKLRERKHTVKGSIIEIVLPIN